MSVTVAQLKPSDAQLRGKVYNDVHLDDHKFGKADHFVSVTGGWHSPPCSNAPGDPKDGTRFAKGAKAWAVFPPGYKPPRKKKCESSCPPTVTLDASASAITAKGGTLTLKALVHTVANGAIDNAKVSFEISPAVNLRGGKAPPAIDVGSVPESTTRSVHPDRAVGLEQVVTKPGQTLPGMDGWTKNGWSSDSATMSTGGGDLIYSDSPEYDATATTSSVGGALGAAGEGVLYRQRGSTVSGSRTPDFRVYFNHENRTNVPKALCLVFSSVNNQAATVTPGPHGLAKSFGNPVAAGKSALIAYEQSRRGSSFGQPLPVPASGAVATCPTTIGNKVVDSKSYAEVANGIYDYTSSAPVQVGVVAVDAGSRASDFVAHPLTFTFIDAAHPTGNPARTYAAADTLSNAGETHVNGTFPYDEVNVELPRWTASAGKRLGVRLAGKPGTTAGEYEAAVDTGSENNGNYGVFYNVTVKSEGKSSEAGQVLLNPRAVGKNVKAHVVNGYAGVVDVPATSGSGKPKGDPVPTPAGKANLTDKNLGIGIGRFAGGKQFTFSFMPPGGASLPVAVVVGPAYVTIKAVLTYKGGKVESKAVTVALKP